MCGRYVILTEEENIEIRDILSEINKRFRERHIKLSIGEIFPTNICPVIKSDGASLVNWGFPKRSGGVVINARSETLHQKPFFAKPFAHSRCLVPASGFYEWIKEESKKTKHLIRHGNIIYMAGLVSPFRSLIKKTVEGFVIITTDAQSKMLEIHNRMPVILNTEKQEIWLSDTKDIHSLQDVMKESISDFDISIVGV